jgi:uncharacterized RDD family membrane protein YckC
MSVVEMQDAQRPGFWRHAFAMLIDITVIGFVLGLAGLALFAPTDGRIRVRSLPIDFTSCSSQAPGAEKIALPSDFHPTNASRCTKSMFGYVYDRTLKLSEVTRSGMTTYSRDTTFPVDADGHPMKAFYLDELSVPLLAIYLLLLEWRFGRTLGKAATGVLIRSLDSGPLTVGQAFKRVLIRIIPFFPLALMLLPRLFGATTLQLGPLVLAAAACVGLGLAILVNFIRASRRSERPWHDKFAGTEAVQSS